MSFFAYMLGLSALFACDLVVTRVLPSADIALWAESRALIGILGVIAALGLDLVMVRSPQSSIRMLGFAAVQVPLLAVLLGFKRCNLTFKQLVCYRCGCHCSN